jgi:hypothetical protein
VQDRVEVPEAPVMLVDESVQVRLVESVVTASETVPVNPLRDATVIVEVAETPAFAVLLAGLALIVKSGALVT